MEATTKLLKPKTYRAGHRDWCMGTLDSPKKKEVHLRQPPWRTVFGPAWHLRLNPELRGKKNKNRYGSALNHRRTAGFVHVSTYQGNPVWGYPIFDPQPNTQIASTGLASARENLPFASGAGPEHQKLGEHMPWSKLLYLADWV